ncbi:polysaccharide pyruvyl transferase family protein [Brachybacterium endophyticum]|uniref:polysaccharide pyruvyl transferase family protein n=1 Tax=Brachybacterium endophyticum TaxID=2182385 RepID=UPI001401C84B|nr:polysaccharide pyruvyl transferase family protein [Brachybacterium endophyticum]
MPKFKVLLLTNNDSDNVGDQIIEASVIALIKAAMRNLGRDDESFVIDSRAAGIINKKYLQRNDPKHLSAARKAISNADLLIFGGAPLFNYAYQVFYRKTITTLEIAQEFGVPVIFSSIGVEKYDAQNEKSQRLKQALQLPVVRQITTRDDFDSVRKYTEETGIPTAHVADPAVYADIVFGPIADPQESSAATNLGAPVDAGDPAGEAPKRTSASALSRAASTSRRQIEQIARRTAHRALPRLAVQARRREEEAARAATQQATSAGDSAAPKKTSGRRIGLVVTRAGIFKDNKINFSEKDQQDFWLDVIAKLKARGDDYRLFTTGHFADEVFLDNIVRKRDVPISKTMFTVNSPEELIGELTACDGVIAYRLHASITSFAYSVPCVGLSWNFKVPYFYDSVGYGHRAIPSEDWNADHVIAQLDRAMDEGVSKKPSEMMDVYRTLFEGIKGVVAPQSATRPYTYEQLEKNLPRYEGTSHEQYQGKVRRKLRRGYESYKKKDVALAQTRKELAQARKDLAAAGNDTN